MAEKMMKYLLIIIMSSVFACGASGATATKELNPKLLSIFDQMRSETEKSKLEGKEFEMDLVVKVATDKFLVFSDAYLRTDEKSKYQIGKWEFAPEQIDGLNAKRGDVCRVRFKIEKIRTDSPYNDMPHFTAKILSLKLADKKVD